MKAIRNIIEIDEDRCTGCGQCILDCAEGALAIVDGKAKVIADILCDGLGACLSGCPENALTVIQREADAYDEKAVEEHLATSKTAKKNSLLPMSDVGCGCPGATPTRLDVFPTGVDEGSKKVLSNNDLLLNETWPLKLGLMQPSAPFLKGADLLLAADCAASTSPIFHKSLRSGRVLLIACPKFEGQDSIAERLVNIFTIARPRSCTVVRMEVPCCQGVVNACMQAVSMSGIDLPVNEVIVSRSGQIIG